MAKKVKVCAKCKATENSCMDPDEDTRHKGCDRCHINLCVNCDRGEYLFGENIGPRLSKMLSDNIDSGKLNRGDFLRLCKQCMDTELNKEFDALEQTDPDPSMDLGTCAKCKVVDRSWRDQFDDTSHRECDKCHTNLCQDCDEGGFLHEEKLAAWSKRSGAHDELIKRDWEYYCKKCLTAAKAVQQ